MSCVFEFLKAPVNGIEAVLQVNWELLERDKQSAASEDTFTADTDFQLVQTSSGQNRQTFSFSVSLARTGAH